MVEGAIVAGNVLTDGTDDVFGADGAAPTTPAGGVTGVAAGNDTSSPVSGGVGDRIAGSFGVLTLNANGSYSYDGTPNVVPPAGATDMFVYTITDGDGDTSTVTLTITLTNSSLAASNDDLTVDEAALATGSNPSSTAETVSGTVVDNVTPGVAPYTYALLSSPTGTHGTLTFNADGSYSYTLTSTVDGATANNGITTENNVETFTYQVTDANGNTTTSTITIDVIDDVPQPIAPVLLVALNANGSSVTAALDSDGTIDDNVGADQPGTVRFPESINGDSGLTSGGIPIMYEVSPEGLVLTATAVGIGTVFIITLIPGATDTYTLQMFGVVDSQSAINFNDGTYDFVGGNTGWAGFVPDGQRFDEVPAPDGSDDLLLTPVGAGTSINGNANAAGVSGGTGPGSGGLSIGTNEGIRLDFVNDLTGDPAGGDFPANSDFVFEDHYEANGAAVTFGGINTGSAAARFTAKNDLDA